MHFGVVFIPAHGNLWFLERNVMLSEMVMDTWVIATMFYVLSTTLLTSLAFHRKMQGINLPQIIVRHHVLWSSMFIKYHCGRLGHDYKLAAWLWPFCNALLEVEEVAKALQVYHIKGIRSWFEECILTLCSLTFCFIVTTLSIKVTKFRHLWHVYFR